MTTENKQELMPGEIWVQLNVKNHYWARNPLETVPSIKYLRADLVPQWQDISMAPRDGSYILVCRDDRKSPFHAVNVIVSNFQNGYYVGYPASYQPTHWLPLPIPPAPKEGEV